MTSPKNAWSDENDIRWYTFKEKDYISVTSMRKMLGMPYNLHRWVVSQHLKLLQAHPEMLDRGKVKGKPETDANIRGRIGRAAMAERDKSAERGTDVHEAIATGQKLTDLPAELQPYVEQYAAAVIALGIKPLQSERQVFSDKYGYAGSFDLQALVRKYDNENTIIDLKTGKNTYNDHAIQGMHYLDADFVGEDDKVDDVATDIHKQATALGILHLKPDGWEYHRVPVTPGLRQAARAMAVLAQFYVKFPDIQSLEVK